MRDLFAPVFSFWGAPTARDLFDGWGVDLWSDLFGRIRYFTMSPITIEQIKAPIIPATKELSLTT
jgi:hypothetical protein